MGGGLEDSRMNRVDITLLNFWQLPLEERMAGFASLRAQGRPVFYKEVPVPFMRTGKGYWALVRHADVSEASRHPEIFMRRNLTRDHEMNGNRYRAGDKVLLFYNSANRDEEVFENPDAFDITREPNPHVGFG